MKTDDVEPVKVLRTPILQRPPSLRNSVSQLPPIQPVPKDPVLIIDPVPIVKPPKTDPKKVPRLKVSPQSVGQQDTDSINLPLPPIFYVIIGRGPAAVINHTTLLQSDFGVKRMDQAPVAGKLPVLHIGFRNPWSWYFAHGMGQPNYLLGLPGFHEGNQPGSEGNNEMKDEGLKSVVFGGCVDREMTWCLGQERDRWEVVPPGVAEAGWPEINGCVMRIQKKAGPATLTGAFDKELGGDAVKAAIEKALAVDYPNFAPHLAPYRLAVLVPAPNRAVKIELIYAQYIDICTGSGRPRQDRDQAVFKTARMEPWRDPATWPGRRTSQRKIAVATEAIRQEFDWLADQRICIANGGAIGLNAAERARDKTCWTDWFHNIGLIGVPPTFANPRNFSFLKAKNEDRPRTPNEDGPIADEDLIAADPRIRMGSFAQPDSVTPACKVVLQQGQPRVPVGIPDPPRIRDYYGGPTLGLTPQGAWDASAEYAHAYEEARHEALPSNEYDYVILHNGLETADLGQPLQLLAEKPAPKSADAARGMTSLETADGFIRILGAAANSPSSLQGHGDKPEVKNLELYRKTLPISAVPDGFILAGINIAAANGFHVATPNPNVNTMTAVEMETALETAGLDKALAVPINAARNNANGFSSVDDLVAKAAIVNPDKPKLAAALKFSYGS